MFKQYNCTPICEEESLKGHTRQLTEGILVERDGGGEGRCQRQETAAHLRPASYSLSLSGFLFFFFKHMRGLRPSLDSPFLLYIFLHWETIFKKRF